MHNRYIWPFNLSGHTLTTVAPEQVRKSNIVEEEKQQEKLDLLYKKIKADYEADKERHPPLFNNMQSVSLIHDYCDLWRSDILRSNFGWSRTPSSAPRFLPLHLAVLMHKLEEVKDLVEKNPGLIHEIDTHGRTAHEFALHLGYTSIAVYLESKSKINFVDLPPELFLKYYPSSLQNRSHKKYFC